jgi:hypothetical protein
LTIVVITYPLGIVNDFKDIHPLNVVDKLIPDELTDDGNVTKVKLVQF